MDNQTGRGYRTVTAAEMKIIEKEADENGLSYRQMMENAGTGAYMMIRERFPETEQLMIFVGKGNNGGDGCVIARLAAADGIKTNVVLCEGHPATEDAKANFDLLEGMKGVEIMTFAMLERNLLSYNGAYSEIFSSKTVVVDAIYGTGMHGEFRSDDIRQICGIINEVSCPVVSLDLPSGLNCDTGEAASGCVQADLTIAFHSMKPAHVMDDALFYCSETVVCDIGIK